MTDQKKILLNRKYLIIFAVIIGFVGVIVGLIIGLEKNNAYEDGRKDEFTRSCIQENEVMLEMIEKDISAVDLEGYCECYADGAILLSKQDIDLENDEEGIFKFFDAHVRGNCGNKELYNQLNSIDRLAINKKSCELSLPIENGETNEIVDCDCVSVEIERAFERGDFVSQAGLQLLMMEKPTLFERCKNESYV